MDPINNDDSLRRIRLPARGDELGDDDNKSVIELLLLFLLLLLKLNESLGGFFEFAWGGGGRTEGAVDGRWFLGLKTRSLEGAKRLGEDAEMVYAMMLQKKGKNLEEKK